MPTYEYYCTYCKFEFEEFQSIASHPITVCPKCEKPTVKRKISGGAALIFKGNGFYITDYKMKKSQKSSQSETKKTTTKLEKESKTS